jgi:hypothetical protein
VTASTFAIGTGRCGTHLLAELFDRDPGVVVRHEAHPEADAYDRYCVWNGRSFDPAALIARKRRAVATAAAAGAAYLEASAYLTLAVPPLFGALRSRFVGLVRDPAETVSSFWVKGWYDSNPYPSEPVHAFSRLEPCDLERWLSLTRIGKLAWFWRALNERMLAELECLPDDQAMLLRVEDIDVDAYHRVATFISSVPRLSRLEVEAVLARRPGAGPTQRDPATWSARERREFRREIGDLPDRLGYSAARTPTRRRRPLRRLFLVDVKRRAINNTPYDVYKLADRFAGEPLDVVDLRFYENVDLPASEAVHLFLETAGTWMCFDWDAARFLRRLDQLRERYPRVTVVGPQARALRELARGNFAVVETVDFAGAIAPGREPKGPISGAWLEAARDRRYNGQLLDGAALRLAPTFSISNTMSCPLACGFCYYARPAYGRGADFSHTLADIERALGRGHRNFYFMDPNFLRGARDLEALRLLRMRWDGFGYYCQVSPNYLTDYRLEQLAASGCTGMVIGIENELQIVAKGTVDAARERVERVRAHGMIPTLFFMIDGRSELEPLVEEFEGVPFRYTVLNDAFAGDRSLRSIERGFEEKQRRADEYRDLITWLEQRPDFLGPARTGVPEYAR